MSSRDQSAPRIRPLAPGEEATAAELVRRAFDETVARDLSREGIGEFYRYSSAEAIADRRRRGARMLVAERPDGSLAGIVEIRDGTHVALLFVDGRGRGVGRALLRAALAEEAGSAAAPGGHTVNSSLGAVRFYESFGFRAEGPEREQDGIRFVPMRRPGGAT